MKRVAVILLVVAISGTAIAGVVVDEQQTVDHGAGSPVTHKITVMIQDKKHKSVIDDGKQTMIINLDNGTRTMFNEARKTYFQMPFPPSNMPMANADISPLSFKKTGNHEKIAGYDCDDYTGSGKMGMNEMMVSGCFSPSAPGVADFASFQKAMSEKVKGTPMAMMSDTPPGVPLKIDTTVKPVTPAGTDKNKPMMTRPPMVTHMVVSKVTAKDLPPDTFQPPKDYTKQEMPMMGGMGPGMMGKPAAPPGANSSAPDKKVPE
jgi:hypothetical protein